MAPIPVHVKHAGKVHDVQLDVNLPASAFKDAVYQVTGVPPERMKVMIKGGMLKDDTDWRKVGPKEGQTFMVIGAAGELPKPPSTPVVFLEDMDDSELAQALALPVGLVNLGNTCYMNSTVQAFRAIPELQTALQTSSPAGLSASLRSLYTSMGSTTDAVTPAPFLTALRQAFPQFAEMSRGGAKGFGGAMYAQQDAEECWVQMTNALKDVPGLPGPSGQSGEQKFVDQFMMGEVTRELKCDEAPEEPPSITKERTLKVECNISANTNYMHSGILDSLNGKIEKNSPSLNRDAVYTSKSRLSRLPTYLTVHMVRFHWRQDIQKKTKILRKVKFPTEYDALDIATDELKEKMLPVSRRLKELEKERSERRKVRKRTKVAKEASATAGEGSSAAAAPAAGDVEMADAAASEQDKGKNVDLEPEATYREKELKELEGLVHADVKTDVGASVSGLYDLVAIVTHKGAAADAGHYMAFVKKSVFHPVKYTADAPGTSAGADLAKGLDEEDEDWYKFDDNKVSVFPKEKLTTLDGGGEDSSAYVLLYKSKPLA